ncbi:hypothetical protein K7I13_02775 [Brucepastera parasyntrophica]|uniref:hypothetical protein n=1 Tax=Brucepastera parasyntrophica TaxID=2880008 RepID=UPI00210DE130|nr:hypothetical protein [Brucepastera parasyntrophica]ULQ60253.1 hypothetical protein K7I13_02775 [Brucepastera parasyntrophica]
MDIDQYLYDQDPAGNSGRKDDSYSTDIVALNTNERSLVNRVLENLRIYSPETMVAVATRIMDLERLSVSISRYPAMQETAVLASSPRTSETLIDALCKIGDGDRLLNLPTKAILGQGFLVAKFHVFASITKVAVNSFFSEEEIEELRKANLTIMFTLMAEDVYMAILDDPNLNDDVRRDVAESLAELWEHRLDQHVTSLAPVLDAIWSVRDQIMPNFGTMIGTSELLLLSIGLDDDWHDFISTRIADPDIASSMEEFLFGLSYEDINYIRKELKSRGLSAIGRDEVPDLIGRTPHLGKEDPRTFYRAYTQRRHNADARKRLSAPGPKKTLEDHYMQFIFEKNREKK